jgi:hypothetical protein
MITNSSAGPRADIEHLTQPRRFSRSRNTTPGEMPERVVHHLEVVDVDEQERSGSDAASIAGLAVNRTWKYRRLKRLVTGSGAACA